MLYSDLREQIKEEVIGFKRPKRLRPLIQVGLFRAQGCRNLESGTHVSRLDNRFIWSRGHDFCHDFRHDKNSDHKLNAEVDYNIQSLWTRLY
ncbi:hypothetical protein V6Z11_D08G253800 [Gossypium hirsutum]